MFQILKQWEREPRLRSTTVCQQKHVAPSACDIDGGGVLIEICLWAGGPLPSGHWCVRGTPSSSRNGPWCLVGRFSVVLGVEDVRTGSGQTPRERSLGLHPRQSTVSRKGETEM